MSALYVTAGGDGRALDVGARHHKEAFAAVRSRSGSVTVRIKIESGMEFVTIHAGEGSSVGGKKLIEIPLVELLASERLVAKPYRSK